MTLVVLAAWLMPCHGHATIQIKARCTQQAVATRDHPSVTGRHSPSYPLLGEKEPGFPTGETLWKSAKSRSDRAGWREYRQQLRRPVERIRGGDFPWGASRVLTYRFVNRGPQVVALSTLRQSRSRHFRALDSAANRNNDTPSCDRAPRHTGRSSRLEIPEDVRTQ